VLEPGDDPKTRIPLVPSMTDKLMNSGEELLHKADHLMVRLSSLLNDENEKNIGGILSNLSSLTDKLSALQKSVDKALVGVPALSADARKTLTHVDALTNDLQTLTKDVQTLSVKAGSFADTSKVELQTTMQRVKESPRCWKIIRKHYCWGHSKKIPALVSQTIRSKMRYLLISSVSLVCF
jgi:phospholipid/cholesterol/gamma-HCH transport system substrate-binding protein